MKSKKLKKSTYTKILSNLYKLQYFSAFFGKNKLTSMISIILGDCCGTKQININFFFFLNNWHQFHRFYKSFQDTHMFEQLLQHCSNFTGFLFFFSDLTNNSIYLQNLLPLCSFCFVGTKDSPVQPSPIESSAIKQL